MKVHCISRLVKNEDLNHHGTLFAGRTAEWFVESGFIAAANEIRNTKEIVCLRVHGLTFKSPIQKGDIIKFESRIAKLGSTSITVYVKVISELGRAAPIEGFLTFISVDQETGGKKPHGLVLDEPVSEEEIQIRFKAENL